MSKITEYPPTPLNIIRAERALTSAAFAEIKHAYPQWVSIVEECLPTWRSDLRVGGSVNLLDLEVGHPVLEHWNKAKIVELPHPTEEVGVREFNKLAKRQYRYLSPILEINRSETAAYPFREVGYGIERLLIEAGYTQYCLPLSLEVDGDYFHLEISYWGGVRDRRIFAKVKISSEKQLSLFL